MKNILLILTIIFLTKCSDGCDGCGDSKISNYGIINGYEKDLSLRFKNADDELIFDLKSEDTTKIWTTLTTPRGLCNAFFSGDGNNNSFPLESVETLTIFDQDQELKVYNRCMVTQECYYSVFEPFTEYDDDGNSYFIINSETLCLD